MINFYKIAEVDGNQQESALSRNKKPSPYFCKKFMIIPTNFSKRAYQKGMLLLGALTANILLAFPLGAAEQISFSYGGLMTSVEIESLTKFAETGEVNKDLQFYFNFIAQDQQKELREVLTKEVELDPVMISRFFNTKMGEEILARLGEVINIPYKNNGKYAIRAALVQAAMEPGGLSSIKVLQKLPTSIQINGEKALALAKQVDMFILATETAVQELATLTAEEAAEAPAVNYAELPDLRQPGPYGVEKVVWHLVDPSRDRHFYVDVFIPKGEPQGKISVLAFSHGLSSRPEDYAVGLQHLASYGYLVVAPQHVGSDNIYLQEMLEGYHGDIFDVNDYINRPKDISFTLDELQRRNQSEFAGRLDLENVGMAGHSFGGYTALAIAGAEIDFDNLQKDCDSDLANLDVALLMQCRALELPRQTISLRDERVKAVFAANPVNRSLFGSKGLAKINIPVVFGSGSYDPAAPPALEQAASFTWLTVPDKYWLLIEGQAHVNFTKLDPGISKAIDSTAHLVLPNQDTIYDYVMGTTVAFFEVYIRQDPQGADKYRPYLSSAYAEYLSGQNEFKLYLVSGKSAPKIRQKIDEFLARYGGFSQD
ncbi:alpha/beta hydrolase [Synechocystis salina]|nr:alpha/beta hydrolase [Synechocystis salina]